LINESVPLKKIFSLLAIATLALTVSGCATQTPQQATNAMFDSLPRKCNAIADGKEAQSINVKDAAKGAPEVTFKAGISPKAAQVHILKQGDGPTFTGDQMAEFEIEALDGPTAKPFDATSGLVTNFDGTNTFVSVLNNSQKPAVSLCDALTGVRAGSRIAAVFPIKSETKPSTSNSVVLVVDLKTVFLPHATGSNQPAASGIPFAVRVESGEPGLTFPSNTDAPTEFKQYTSVKGAGDVLKTGDHIKVHYKLYSWDSAHTMIQSSWASEPLDMTVGTGTIQGFTKAIVGQTVGSQVVAVIPPALGYGDNPPQGITANATLVFVIDILGKY
jgi:peptidylprolyl isomerase